MFGVVGVVVLEIFINMGISNLLNWYEVLLYDGYFIDVMILFWV